MQQQQKLLYQHQQQLLHQQQQQALQQQQVGLQQGGEDGNSALGDMMNIQGRSTTGSRGVGGGGTIGAGGATGNGTTVPGVKYGADTTSGAPNSSSNAFPRSDLVPISDEIPPDGIIFARLRGNPNTLVVFRTPEERLRNPERLNWTMSDRNSASFGNGASITSLEFPEQQYSNDPSPRTSPILSS